MLYIGFALIALSSLGMVLTQRSTSSSFMLTTMLVGGLGFGLVLPNLTIFAQQTAPREHLGISTALLQSLRMIGGMLGTAITGTLVNRLYAGGVQRALVAEQGEQWLPQFRNPEILLDHAAQQSLLAQAVQADRNGEAMINAAREALVASIHTGVALAIVVSLIGLWMVRRVPHVSFHRPIAAAPLAD
jgi:hypothetical protein